MSLSPGTHLGPYEIAAPIGAGGMGEVYRARDTRLNRDVAIKVLPDRLARDPERLARFTREAQTLAALNHPNIAQIYGIEESASIRAIVMELVPGEDLSARIAKGPIPLAEALPLARQVADALEAAHENGIVHRDLKPANVKVTTDGRIKILDFGLAKLGTAGATGSGGSDSGSPTLTAATEVGTILGTAAYMAPEQAEGKNVDKRADVWAFGVLLYEMLTGRSLFTGASTTEVLAAVIRDTPDWSALPAHVSPAVRRLLARCLAKDPKRRLRDIGDARFELEEMDAAGEHPDAQKTRFAVPVWVLAIAVLVAGTLGAVLMVGRPSETPPGAGTRRAAIELGSLSDSRTFSFPIALSGDGSLLVYTVGRASGSPLYARRLDSLEARPIEGTAGAVGPFLSRDGRLIGFEREGGIFSVPLAGGPVVHARGSAHLPGGSPAWTEDGRIVLTSSSGALVSVNADGSSPRTLTTPSPGERHLSPFPLPGGRTILFTAVGADPREARLAAVSLADGQVRSLVDGGASTGQFADGYLVYARPDQRLMAVLFDATRVEKTGVPQPLPDRVTWTRFGIAHFSVAPGVLVYFPPAVTSLVEVDRGGGRQTLWTDRQWHHPRYSPDGTRIVVDVTGDDGERDVWVFDRALKTLSRTTRIGDAHDPSWLPDGQSVSFLSFKSGGVPLLVARADGTSPPEPLRLGSGFSPEDLVNPGGWIRDGSAYVGGVQDRGSPSDLWLLPGDGSNPVKIIGTPADELAPAISPSGKWIAYQSDETGRGEIYVRALDGRSGRAQVSNAGGREPVWDPGGTALYYVETDGTRDRLVAARLRTSPAIAVLDRTVLFPDLRFEGSDNHANYDVHPDGRRFVLPVLRPSAHVVAVFDWARSIAPAADR